MNGTVRDRRLASDFEAVRELCAKSGGRIAIEATEGVPPHAYTLRYEVRTLGPCAGDVAPRVRQVRVQVLLPAPYPSPGAMPLVQAVGPVFHPHFFANGRMCLGSAPLAGLAWFVEWVGRSLVLDPQVINTSSPACAEAMAWVRKHGHLLPLDPVDFRVPVVRAGEAQAVAPVSAPAPRIAWLPEATGLPVPDRGLTRRARS